MADPWDELDSPAWMHAARMAELGVLSASLIHELRQPLFALKAMSQLSLADGQMPAQRLLQLAQQIDHMQELVDAYSGFSNAAESSMLFDFNDPVRNALQMLTHRGKAQGVSVRTDLGVGFLPVRGRPSATQQVVVNLLANAYDAVESAGGGTVTVHTEMTEDSILLSVLDTGIGVPEHLLEEVFQPFVTTKSDGRGTGLGLYIARRIVAQADGELTLANVEGGGTRVSVRLPRAA